MITDQTLNSGSDATGEDTVLYASLDDVASAAVASSLQPDLSSSLIIENA
jgi:hypothetical protein